MAVVRFGVSLEQDLLESLDDYAKENKFSNRSQAIRQLISSHIVEKRWMCNNLVAGSITLVYNHHKRDILNKLTEIQHEHLDCILASQHFHIDHGNCMEIIAVRGQAAELTELSGKLIAVKGIQHGKLTMSRTN